MLFLSHAPSKPNGLAGRAARRAARPVAPPGPSGRPFRSRPVALCLKYFIITCYNNTNRVIISGNINITINIYFSACNGCYGP